ncbi:hypothetical protein R1flu_009354 [Riccia fluitans]|uniref:Uncharacterized protein n=1 Tax=Riccia fluitans TaxID=41844 RepID=A0ABD1Z4V7_9MARC
MERLISKYERRFRRAREEMKRQTTEALSTSLEIDVRFDPGPHSTAVETEVGPRPSLHDCVEGLGSLYQMHYDEQKDVSVLLTLLSDQPSTLSEEVQCISYLPGMES